jgi:ribulose-phosphate 3-epimerase
MLEKLRRLKKMIEKSGYDVKIEIDGGVDETNIAKIVDAGAEMIVAGSAVFDSGDAESAVRRLLEKGAVWV